MRLKVLAPTTGERRGTLIHGDCLEAIKRMPDNYVHSIVTDPPYEIGFGSKAWDSTGIAYSVELWKECLRVLKPGGHLISFGASRTFHRMACAVEDAGFEIRDEIIWSYMSGMSKGSTLDKAITTLDPEAASDWKGWNTALAPAFEPATLARKPLGESTVAKNVLKHGTGAMNIDGTRLPLNPDELAAPLPTGMNADGRWPKNMIIQHGDDCILEDDDSDFPPACVAGCPMADLDHQAIENQLDSRPSRVFLTAKASQKERPKIAGVVHSTVKSIVLMRHLVKLITPPNGIVLEPFCGSGTTAEAAMLEGFRFIAIEQDADYCRLIESRLTRHDYLFNFEGQQIDQNVSYDELVADRRKKSEAIFGENWP